MAKFIQRLAKTERISHSIVTCHLSPGGQAGLGHRAVLPQFPAAPRAEPRGRGGVRAVHVARVDEGGHGVELLPVEVLLVTALDDEC